MTSITIPLDYATEARLRFIAEELNRDIWDLVASAVTETALDYFRHRHHEDPARGVTSARVVDLIRSEGTWQ